MARKNLYHSQNPEGHFTVYMHNPIKAIYTSVEIFVLEGLKPCTKNLSRKVLSLFNNNKEHITVLLFVPLDIKPC